MMSRSGAEVLPLVLLDRPFAIDCPDPGTRDLFRRLYSLAVTEDPASDAIAITVREKTSGGFVVESPEGATQVEGGADLRGLVWAVGTNIVQLLQRARSELLFLHGAAVAREERALVLLAQSGGGKSTTTWGLLHHGFDLMSDELAPIDGEGAVIPFPRALHLKRRPPHYPLPEDVLVEDPPFHLPLEVVSTVGVSQAVRPALLGFLEHRDASAQPEITPVGPAEATARIYASSLNALAHDGKGVDACLALARVCPAYRIVTGELRSSCTELRSLFDALIAGDLPLA